VRSKLAGQYVHLSGVDLDETLLRLNRVTIDNQTESPIGIIACQRCHGNNNSTSEMCGKCGLTLHRNRNFRIEGAQSSAERVADLFLEDLLGQASKKKKGVAVQNP
jgi:uncharacterized paraquat-inducible protein A